MEVHLGGHLGFYGPGRRSRFEVHLDAQMTLLELIRELGIPEAEIDLAAVNLAIVSLHGARVGDADRLDLYPPMGGGAPADALVDPPTREPAARTPSRAGARRGTRGPSRTRGGRSPA